MYEFAFVLLFSAAGGAAALLAMRAGGAAPAIRWLARVFLVVVLVNLGLYVWPFLAADPDGTKQALAVALVVGLAWWGYVRLLRRARRMADERRDRR